MFRFVNCVRAMYSHIYSASTHMARARSAGLLGLIRSRGVGILKSKIDKDTRFATHEKYDSIPLMQSLKKLMLVEKTEGSSENVCGHHTYLLYVRPRVTPGESIINLPPARPITGQCIAAFRFRVLSEF